MIRIICYPHPPIVLEAVERSYLCSEMCAEASSIVVTIKHHALSVLRFFARVESSKH